MTKISSSTSPLAKWAIATLSLIVILFNSSCGSVRALSSQANENEQLIDLLKSVNKDEAASAVTRILNRGDAMIPLLLKCKGDSRPFYGYGLGDRRSSFLLPLPTGDQKRDQGRVITVEVAALYLISAIFYDSLEFAQAPYLTDGSPVKNQRFNTPKRVSAAWKSVEQWSTRLKEKGLASLKAGKDSPLRDSQLRFWATAE